MSNVVVNILEQNGITDINLAVDETFMTGFKGASETLSSLKHLSELDPKKMESFVKWVSPHLGQNTAYRIEELLSMTQGSMDIDAEFALKGLGDLMKAYEIKNTVVKITEILKDGSVSAEEAKFLAEIGYDNIADAMLNAAPGINVIINLPIVGEPIKVVLKKGGKFIGDNVGPAMDSAVEKMMDKTGFKDWVIANQDHLDDPARIMFGDPADTAAYIKKHHLKDPARAILGDPAKAAIRFNKTKLELESKIERLMERTSRFRNTHY